MSNPLFSYNFAFHVSCDRLKEVNLLTLTMLFGRYINKYYLKYAFFFIAGVAALVIVDLAQLFVPKYLGDIVELLSSGAETIPNETRTQIISMIIGTVVVAAVMMVGRFLWRITIFHASFKIEAGLRKQMFEKAERLSQRYYHENKVGAIMAWFTNDIETIQEFFGWGTIMLVDAFFLSTLVIIQMFMIEPILALISVVPVLLIVLWGALGEKFWATRWEARQQTFDSLYDYSQETFTGISVIKAFVKETQQIHTFAKLAKKDKEANIRFARMVVIFDTSIEIIIALISCIMIGFGGYFVYQAINSNPVVIFGHQINLTAGKLVSFVGYFDLLIWPMIALGQIVSMRSRAKTSLKRISRFLDEPEEIKDKEGAINLKNVQGKITFKNFSFKYPGEKDHSLENISLEIQPGETVGVIGKIGSGKTTLVNSLLRLYNIEEGSIEIDDVDIMNIKMKSIRNSIAYVPQDNFLFSDTITNNIGFAEEKPTLDAVKQGAKFSDVDKDIISFKDGYDTVSGERGVTLSGGQKQRISIARAFVKNSPIMILDDSVSAVDVSTEETILKNVAEERKGKTTIVVASRVSTVAHLDKIIVLNNGTLEAFGSPKELLKTSNTYKNMVYLQRLERELEGGEQHA